jgi:aryl-alcohol dehydrogenase-like predicted oxidoreductase
MRYKHLLGTDLKVSALCLGTVGFGERLTEAESFRQMDTFFEQGGSFLDTARIYSDWLPGEKGRSERVIGDYLADRKNRDRRQIATKGGHPLLSAMDISRVGRRELFRDVDDSLQALRTDYIDLYYLHRDNRALGVEEIIGWMNELVAAGKIRYFGCSNWITPRIAEAQRYAESSGRMGFCANQALWNVGCFTMTAPPDPSMVIMDKEMIRFHRETGLAALPYSSQAGGFFQKLHRDDKATQDAARQSSYASSTNIALFSVLKELAENHETSISRIVLSYLLSQRTVVIPVFSSHSIRQLDDAIGAVNIELSEQEINRLDALNGSGLV